MLALCYSEELYCTVLYCTVLYSLCCSEELPSRLSLPAVLATATSTQNLASLALLGKSEYHMMMMMMMMMMMLMMMMMMMMMIITGFWSYPMAACSRASVCGDTGDMETVANNNNNNNNNNNGGPLTRTVSPHQHTFPTLPR